jgi:hypothetical protein
MTRTFENGLNELFEIEGSDHDRLMVVGGEQEFKKVSKNAKKIIELKEKYAFMDYVFEDLTLLFELTNFKV